MKILILYRLVRYIAAYHFLSYLVVFLVLELNGASGRSDVKTKHLLQNIRTHLAQKADEIIKKKECESGLILCKSLKTKEGDEEKSEEIPPPPKTVRGQHKPVIRVNPKDVIQTMMPKVHKSIFRKPHKFEEIEKHMKMLHFPENDEEDNKKDESEEATPGKPIASPEIKKSLKFIKKLPQTDRQVERSPDEKSQRKVVKPDIKEEKPQRKVVKPDIKEEKLQRKVVKPDIKEEKPQRKVEKADIKEEKPQRKVVKLDVKEEKPQRKVVKSVIQDEKKLSQKKPLKETSRERALEKGKEEKKTDRIEGKKKTESKIESTAKETSVFLTGTSFVFFLESDSLQNTVCEKHSQVYLKQLKKYQIWALMMYDASAKFPSGVLQGNVNQFGDFDECLAINAVFKNKKGKSKKSSGIKGKYCLATIDVATDPESKNLRLARDRAESFQFIKSTIHDPGHFIPRFSTMNWGLCVPSACVAEDVEKFLKHQLESLTNATGLQFEINVDEANCVVKDDLKFQLQTDTIIVTLFYLFVLSISVLGTFLDTKHNKKTSEREKYERELKEAATDVTSQDELETKTGTAKFSLREKTKNIIMAFSLKRNARKLFNDNSKGAIECINGIKSIFTVMLYFAHKTIPLGMTPFTNRVFLTKISNQPITILLRASIIYTDSFLLISGVLTSYNLAKDICEKKKTSWVRKSAARFIRLTPALFAVVLFYAYIWNRLGSGPVWNLLISKNSSLCRKYMWRNLLYIQNFFPFEDMCAPQTHQLALDMQLSLLAPFFVHLIHKYDKTGVGILQAFFILSSIMRYVAASNNNLSVVIYHGMSVSQLYKTANLLYGQTFHRASPYILGTIVGYYLKKFEKRFDMPKAFAALGWILSFTFGFYSVVSPSPLALRAYQYDVHEAAQYAALSPVAWSLALSWLIAACHLGYGGLLNDFLSQKIFLVFSRISYSVYLTQFLVFFYNVGITRIPEWFTLSGSFNVTEFFAVVGISVIVTLLFDIPMMEVKKIILDKSSPALLPLEGGERSDNDEHSKSSEIEKGSETISREDSQETTEELIESIEDEAEYADEDIDEEIEEEEGELQEGIGGNEEEEEEGELQEGIEGNEEEEEENEEVSEVVFQIRPLRRSTRMHFRDESEDTEVFKVEPKTEEQK